MTRLTEESLYHESKGIRNEELDKHNTVRCVIGVRSLHPSTLPPCLCWALVTPGGLRFPVLRLCLQGLAHPGGLVNAEWVAETGGYV